MPAISIIIPSFNSEKHIAETIDSILGQTFADIEILVVDDGSSDRTREIVRSYAASSPVQLITQKNSGVCVARNHGLRRAQGSYICFMDHDDYWFPDKLQRQIAAFEAYPDAGVIYSCFVNWHADAGGDFPPANSFEFPERPDEIDPDFSGWIYHQFLTDCWMLTSTAMFRREVLTRCGSFDESLPYSEDWDLWLRISREYPMIKLRRPTTLYRQHRLQGNRVVRDIDYRTRLLSASAEKWGLCSRDGRCIERKDFRKQLSIYHVMFALSHLRGGKLPIAIKAFAKAWLAYPYDLRLLGYIPAALLGWRPR